MREVTRLGTGVIVGSNPTISTKLKYGPVMAESSKLYVHNWNEK